MSDAAIHRQCMQVVRALDIQPPCDTETMVSAAEALAHRDIRVLQRSGLGRLTGFVLDDGHYVDIWVDAQLTDFARRHVVAHQLGHVLLGHTRAMRSNGATRVWDGGAAAMECVNALLLCDQLGHAAEDAANSFARLLLGAPTSEFLNAPAPRVEMSADALDGVGERVAPASLSVVAGSGAKAIGPDQRQRWR